MYLKYLFKFILSDAFNVFFPLSTFEIDKIQKNRNKLYHSYPKERAQYNFNSDHVFSEIEHKINK